MQQGDLTLLEDPVAKELLDSAVPARLAYVWRDGTPRVVPVWFHWTGREVVIATPPAAPKLKVLEDGSHVSVTIDTDSAPWHVLLLRARARVEMVDGIVSEYADAAIRYMGVEAARAWLEQMEKAGPGRMARIALTPHWVAVLDFTTRFPSALGL